ncbi:hypothetical protein [Thermococcus piezophilus]|nr:hypothetical protein [Thermococcus piezophilus]
MGLSILNWLRGRKKREQVSDEGEGFFILWKYREVPKNVRSYG